ncbi:carbohydrate ABC transporter permease [Gordonia liuliyuniae]|uniref:ABC transporter permease subunit n=1 Tax=Gordonia liuliyuniae TaxID=2911517 RepID=A0ABS9IXE6_9ACTN|nr:sugar ABC transporter permease [Gordonia liuliyuniae]MCF8590254.1 ABC transporter permease subunit [Gordonia liuliyuniae]
MTSDDNDEPTNRGGLTPHGDGPDTSPGRHARPEDRAPERPVEQTGPIPTVHSDVWVAPGTEPTRPTATPPETRTVVPEPKQTPVSPQAAEPRPESEQPQQQTPQQETPRPPTPQQAPAPGVRPAVDTPRNPVQERRPAPARAGSAMAMSDILEVERPAQATPQTVGAKQSGVTKSGRKSSERRLAFLLAGPAALVMLVVTGYPILYSIWLSFTDENLREPGSGSFVGFSNYGTVLGSGYWWTALWVTAYITVISVIIELVIGMAIALVMHRAMFGRGLVRTVVLIPYGIVTVAAAISWKYAWTPGTGYLVNLLPDGSTPLTSQMPALSVIILAEVWKTTPFMALLLLAGLALVPDDLLKAAQVDGAGAWTRLVKVILPLMKPAILVALLFRTLDAFRVFDNIYVLTSGNHDTGSVSMLGYNNLFKAFNLGTGSAISVLIFLCVAVIAIVFIKGFGASAPGSDDEGR